MNEIRNIDCRKGLKEVPDETVQCIVTSPPYFGLRDYGMADQIGLEETPEHYISEMVEVFRECRRVLKKDGTLWLNIGDSYASGKMTPHKGQRADRDQSAMSGHERKLSGNYKHKDLIGAPWMLAFALRNDGWYLRQDIIWHKPNPMPESVTDRCTKAHEYLFLLSKSNQYYFDHVAISEPAISAGELRKFNTDKKAARSIGRIASGNEHPDASAVEVKEDKNKRSVWTVTPKPFPEAHFATFPEDLIVDCIKAGSKEGDLIMDPFMGAGTTALVARKLNRNYLGFELNPEYIKIAEKRLRGELGMFY